MPVGAPTLWIKPLSRPDFGRMLTMPTPCECCWITQVQKSLSDRSPYCHACRGHLFNIDHLRADHQQQVTALIAHDADEVAKVKASVKNCEQAIAGLKVDRDQLVQSIATGFTDAPIVALRDLIRDSAIDDVEKRASGAYFTRDRAMAAVWRMDERHHEVANDKCSCGTPLRACRDHKAIEFFRPTFYAWERRQIELMKAGKQHGLPVDHPESRKHFTEWYRWKGGLSTVPEGRPGLSAWVARAEPRLGRGEPDPTLEDARRMGAK